MLEHNDLSKEFRKPRVGASAAGPKIAPVVERVHAPPRMRLWAMDAWVRRRATLTNLNRIREIMYDAAQIGGVTVLGEEFYEFDNAAVTGVLVLAQSHLSIHTWPEYSLANVDLLSYGDVGGEEVVRAIGGKLGAERVNVACLLRALP